MLNESILQGRLTAEPELRKTTSEISVLSFCVASERSRVKAGEERQADFINCVAWRNTAEFISRYFHKGDMILVQGNLQSRNYTDKNGNKRNTVEIVVSQANFCGGKKSSNENMNNNSYNSANKQYNNSNNNNNYNNTNTYVPPSFSNNNGFDFTAVDMEDELPF